MKKQFFVIGQSFLLMLFMMVLGQFAFLNITSAQSGSYENYDVTFELNKDSTMTVTENVTTKWTGVFRFVTRDITLENYENTEQCRKDPSLQCGGFDYIHVLGVYDEYGNRVPDYEVEQSIIQDGTSNKMQIKWTFSPGGMNFYDDNFNYSIKYKVYGSVGYFSDYDLFYWNVLPSQRPAVIDKSVIKIIFPEDVNFTKENLRIFVPLTGLSSNYTTSYDSESNTITIDASYVQIGQEFTTMYKFPKGIIHEYAKLNLKVSPDPINISLYDFQITEKSRVISGLVPGKTKLVFSQKGYISKEITVNLEPGETRNLQVSLEADPVTKLYWIMTVICSIFACMMLPFGLLMIYWFWDRNGRDINRRKVVIPYYSPPDNIRPYLLGSIKDERVDMVDITGSIIDLAYRGYIKIREFKEKKVLGVFGGATDYEFIKRKEFDDLPENEKDILEGMFGLKQRITMSRDLKNKFYLKIPDIQDGIYQEMQDRKYFNQRPDKVVKKYRIIGILMIVLGFSSFCAMFFFPIVVLGVVIVILGITMLITASHMPAKTSLGSKVLDEILGFRMYMNTAERFRVQNLTPETFEKYLSYAIVFGIEKEWAKKFKDIYLKPPDWYEADTFTAWSTIYFINSLSAFTTASATSLVSAPPSSSGYSSGGFSGGGWSGGGGFSGGFSGGGGGGGGSGWG